MLQEQKLVPYKINMNVEFGLLNPFSPRVYLKKHKKKRFVFYCNHSFEDRTVKTETPKYAL